MQFGWVEILLVIAAIVLLFGTSRLPQLARSIGQSRKAFKDGLRYADDVPSPIAAKTEVSSLSDEEVLAEIERRAASKSQASN